MKKILILIGLAAIAIACIYFTRRPQKMNSEALPSNTQGSVKKHEVIIVLENHSYEQVIGNSQMPYLNNLAQSYGLAKNYYANIHPSIGNYFMLAAGQIITNNDNFNGTIGSDNIITALGEASKSWRVYAEDIPAAGYLGSHIKNYLKRHNPIVYTDAVLNDPELKTHVVPFFQLSQDVASGNLPEFVWIVPNACHDAHDCPLGTADAWLKSVLEPLLSDQEFKDKGLVVITFDEAPSGDKRNGGGHVPTIFAGGQAKPNYSSLEFYQHQNLLRTMLENLDIHTFPGAAATASSMSEFLK